MKRGILTAFALAICSTAYGTPTLRLTSGSAVIEIADGDPGDANSFPGFVQYIGAIGNFSMDVTIGVEVAHSLGGDVAAPFLDINSSSGSQGVGGTLKIEFSDTDYGPSSGSFQLAIGGTLATGGSLSYAAYAGAGNLLFEKSDLIGTLGPFSGSPFSQNATGLIPVSNPYSLTLEVSLTHPASGAVVLRSGFDATIEGAPAERSELGDFVWEDLNLNGQQDVGEPGIPNVRVELTDCSGTVLAATMTDGNGKYLFPELLPGMYAVKFTTPGGYFPTIPNQGPDVSDSDAVGGVTQCVTLVSGESNLTLDAGFYRPAALGDFVWSDTNGNGIQDSGEPGILGVSVLLYDCDGNLLPLSTTTDVNGYYLFTGLVPGGFKVKFIQPAAGFQGFSPQDQGADSLDSDASSSGFTGCYILSSGETNLTADAGLVPIPCEPSLTFGKDTSTPTVPVGGTATYRYAVTNTGCSTLTDIVVTDDNGTPEFPGDDFVVGTIASLAPGQVAGLTKSVALPVDLCGPEANGSTEAGLLIASVISGGPNDGDIEVIFIQAFNRNDNTYGPDSVNFGWKPNRPHRFKDLVNSDQVTFSVRNAAGAEVLKFQQDYISASSAFPSGYGSLGVSGGDGAIISGSAANLYDFNSSLAENLNQSPALALYTTESPLLSDPNSLLWEYRMIYKFKIRKAAFGGGAFGGVVVVDQHNSPPKSGPESFTPVPCGTCIVNTATVTAHAGAQVLTASDTATVCTGTANPPPQPATLGDRVWIDTNKNGIQDNGELGLSDVTVKLLTCSGTVLDATVTGPSGEYFFTGLAAGSYKVQFVLPSGYLFTLADQGDDAFDSDADSSGLTACVTLAAGEDNRTLDAGIYVTTVTPPPSGVGTGTPGYWKNHPEAWPVASIVIGGKSYTRAAAIALMMQPTKNDKTYNMFEQLVSAKLNVLIGNASSCIVDTINAADAWMAIYPVGSGVKASSSAWSVGGPLHSKLDDYNNGDLCAPHRG